MNQRIGKSHKLRTGRRYIPKAIYLLTTRTKDRQRFFTRPDFAQILLNCIQWQESSGAADIIAAVVMPDHVHLVCQIKAGTISTLMKSIKQRSSFEMRAAGVECDIWQPGFHDHAIRADESLSACIDYVLQNPVRAEIVTSIDEYPFVIFPRWWKKSL